MKRLLFRIALLSGLLIFVPSLFAQGEVADSMGKVVSKYNQDKDQTEIEITQLPISVDRSKAAFLGVTIVFKGKKPPSRLDEILFIVSVVTRGPRKYPDTSRVSIMSQGKAIGDITMLNLDQRAFSADEILETIGTRMAMEVFRKLIEQPVVTFQIGESTFQISRETIGKLIEFDNAIRTAEK